MGMRLSNYGMGTGACGHGNQPCLTSNTSLVIETTSVNMFVVISNG